MRIKLLKDVQVSIRETYPSGSTQTAMMGNGLWMKGLRNRPLNDDEWELVIDDADVEKEFSKKEKG